MYRILLRRIAGGLRVTLCAMCCQLGLAQESAKAEDGAKIKADATTTAGKKAAKAKTGAATGTAAMVEAGPPVMDRAPVTLVPGRRLPNQGGFRNGQDMYDWLGGAGDIWWDGSNPISTADAVKKFVAGQGSDAMKAPRPKKVKLYMQGGIPRLRTFTYQQCADNDPKVKAAWVEIAKACVEGGYRDCVFGSSETQTSSKRWMPSADDINSGRWKKAWMNMVDDIRSVMPDAKFAFVPFTGNQFENSGMAANPDNKIDEKDMWYVAGKDEAGRPYMDFWGSTVYFGTHPAKWGYPKPVTKDIIDQCMDAIRSPVTNCHTNWGFMANYQYAREKGIKMVIGEIGITNRNEDKKMAMGDQPYAIDLLTKLMVDCSDLIEFVCWFNLRNGGTGWNSLDGKSNMPHAAKRVQELWGPDSPYRK